MSIEIGGANLGAKMSILKHLRPLPEAEAKFDPSGFDPSKFDPHDNLEGHFLPKMCTFVHVTFHIIDRELVHH